MGYITEKMQGWVWIEGDDGYPISIESSDAGKMLAKYPNLTIWQSEAAAIKDLSYDSDDEPDNVSYVYLSMKTDENGRVCEVVAVDENARLFHNESRAGDIGPLIDWFEDGSIPHVIVMIDDIISISSMYVNKACRWLYENLEDLAIVDIRSIAKCHDERYEKPLLKSFIDKLVARIPKYAEYSSESLLKASLDIFKHNLSLKTNGFDDEENPNVFKEGHFYSRDSEEEIEPGFIDRLAAFYVKSINSDGSVLIGFDYAGDNFSLITEDIEMYEIYEITASQYAKSLIETFKQRQG